MVPAVLNNVHKDYTCVQCALHTEGSCGSFQSCVFPVFPPCIVVTSRRCLLVSPTRTAEGTELLSSLHFHLFCGMFQCSSYPSSRFDKDSEGVKMGVMGSVSLVQNAVLSSQPVSSFDWHPNKVGMQCVCVRG